MTHRARPVFFKRLNPHRYWEVRNFTSSPAQFDSPARRKIPRYRDIARELKAPRRAMMLTACGVDNFHDRLWHLAFAARARREIVAQFRRYSGDAFVFSASHAEKLRSRATVTRQCGQKIADVLIVTRGSMRAEEAADVPRYR